MKIAISELKNLMANDKHLLLVDVRTREEYDAGHIPGAGCMPVEDIVDCLYDEALAERGLDDVAHGQGMEMADDASVIVLYSGTGKRSAQAVEHMEALAYVNVYDAGGLDEWPYDLVTTAQEVDPNHIAQGGQPASGQVVGQNASDAETSGDGGDACGCGHDHADGHHHDHGHGDGCGCGNHA